MPRKNKLQPVPVYDVDRGLMQLKRDFTLIEERIFLNTAILTHCPLNEDGIYIGEYGMVERIVNKDGVVKLYEVKFNADILLGNGAKDGKRYNNVQIIKNSFQTYNKNHLYFYLEEAKVWVEAPPFAIIVGDVKNNIITASIMPEVWELYRGVNKTYNRIELKTAFRLQSHYSLRMLELFCSLDRPITYSIQKLKEMFCCEEKYIKNKDFLNRVIFKGFKDLEKEGYCFPFTVNRGTKQKVESITINPCIIKTNIRKTLNTYGIQIYFTKEELDEIEKNFTKEEIIKNIKTFTYVKWHTNVSLTEKMRELNEKSKSRSNPKGWIISILRSIEPRNGWPLVKL